MSSEHLVGVESCKSNEIRGHIMINGDSKTYGNLQRYGAPEKHNHKKQIHKDMLLVRESQIM